MRSIALVSLAFVLLLPMAVPCLGQELLAPKTETVFPGVTRISYADQVFVFTTTVRLSVTFQIAVPGKVQIRVNTSAKGLSLVPGQKVHLYWEDGDEVLYDDARPDDGWIGFVLTEGGLTEK
jgi:hypothetical protein